VIHLDTSFLVRSLAPGSPEDALLRGWLRDDIPLAISSIAWAEYLCGPVEANEVAAVSALVGLPIAFDESHAVRSSELFNAGGRRRGTMIDCMIGAVAVLADAALATSNAADFRRLEGAGLRLVEARLK
jgi:predicted nucleic acid-binding protein